MADLTDLQKDYDAYFSNTATGTKTPFAGGELIKRDAGASWSDPEGKQWWLQADTPIDTVAGYGPSIAKGWGEKYGYEAPSGSPEILPAPGQQPAPQQATPAPTQQAAEAPITQDYQAPAGASVSERLTDLLDKDNPFVTRRRTAALKEAAGRGLQSTTMAQQAAESAGIDAGLGIAKADAELFANLYSQERAGEIASGASAQQAAQQGWLYNLQGDITAGLSRLDASQQMALQTTMKNMDNAQQTRMAEYEANVASNLSAQEAAQGRVTMMAQIDAENVWEEKFLNQKIALEEAQIDATARDSVRIMTTDINQDYQKDRMEILLNPNFATSEDRDAALEQLNYITGLRMQNLATIYGTELDWSPTEWVAPEDRPTDVIPEETPEPLNEVQQTEFEQWSEQNKDMEWFKDMTDADKLDLFKFYSESGQWSL